MQAMMKREKEKNEKLTKQNCEVLRSDDYSVVAGVCAYSCSCT